MAADCGLRHLQHGAQFRARQLLLLEHHEHAAARRIGERRHVVEDWSHHLSVNPDIRLHQDTCQVKGQKAKGKGEGKSRGSMPRAMLREKRRGGRNGSCYCPEWTIIMAMKRISIQDLK